MTPHEAAKLLDLPVDATPEQIETRFSELRAKLEDKVVKAPTPGLKAKYRESLEELTAAFEQLTLAADASALPMLNRQSAVSGQPSAGGPASLRAAATAPVAPAPKSKRSGGGKEFALVAVLALAVLGAGGWWVMKTRAENETKARLAAEAVQKAAEQKAETERQAQLAKEKAEQDRLAKEATAQAEKERQERQFSQLRSRLAELNVTYDALARQEQVAERQLSESKGQVRELSRASKSGPTPEARRASAQLAAQERFTTWLGDALPVHPAKVARARAEELLSARAGDDATTAVETYASALNQLKGDIAAAREAAVITGPVSFTANQEGVQWEFVDAFGQVRQGTAPATLPDAALGAGEVTFRLAPYPEQKMKVTVAKSATPAAHAEFHPARITIKTNPAQARIYFNGAPHDSGTIFPLPPARHLFRIEAQGYAAREIVVEPKPGTEAIREVTLDNTVSSQALEEIRSLSRNLTKRGSLYDRVPVMQAFAAAGENSGAIALAHELDAFSALYSQPYEWTTDLQIVINSQDSNLAVAILMVAGENPFGKGLQSGQFADYWGAVEALCARGRADLAFDWITLARQHGVSGSEQYTHVLRDGWCKLAAAAVRQGRMDLARQAFDRALAASRSKSLDFENLITAARELWQAARDRADPVALEALAGFALAATQEDYNDSRYARNDRVLVDAVHFLDWADPLIASGWGARFQPYLDFVLANKGSLEEPRIPAKPVPFAGPPAISQLQPWLATVSAKPSDIGSLFQKISARIRARQALAKGQPELARKHAAYADNDYKPLDLARDFARLGNWKSAEALIPELHFDAGVQAMYRSEFAQLCGRALAEQMEPVEALARLREIPTPEARLEALCGFVIRLRETRDFTLEQRALLQRLSLI